MKIETVKVIADVPGGYKVINKADMKESDKIYKEQAQKPAAKKKAD